jgi:hypothetical protein
LPFASVPSTSAGLYQARSPAAKELAQQIYLNLDVSLMRRDTDFREDIHNAD